MITAYSITKGDAYLRRHLTANDYYAEGERIEGEWFGEGAKRLGLKGAVDPEVFECVRCNTHPQSGERLTARNSKPSKVTNPLTGKVEERHPIALHDITFGAPKTASIVAIVGGDSRVTEAFREATKTALTEMEHFAAVRLRTGAYHGTEKLRITGEITAAVFHHDASRELDPQLHAHAVMANASYDTDRDQWFALQRLAMMQASPYVRKVLYHDYARRLQALGYELEPEGESFRIKGISPEVEEAFKQRSLQREAFEIRYRKLFGHQPSKRRAEQFIRDAEEPAKLRFAKEFQDTFGRAPTDKEVSDNVKDWRNQKLQEISTPEVRTLQSARLSEQELESVRHVVRQAQGRKGTPLSPYKTPQKHREAAQQGIDHCLERLSVSRLGEILDASLRFGAPQLGDLDPKELRHQLLRNSEVIQDGYLLTTETALKEEAAVLRFARNTRGEFPSLGTLEGDWLGQYQLSTDQQQVVEKLAASRDGISVLVGDAGTGKTHTLKALNKAHVLRALEQAHEEAAGHGFVALAPTTRATQELQENGYPEATTVAGYLVNAMQQEGTAGRTLLIDEAGLLSSRQLAQLAEIARERNLRLLLVGDPKQHESVERGSALRNLISSKLVTPVRLSQVRRQQSKGHRQLAKLLAAGKAQAALEHADQLGMVSEVPHVTDLFAQAATRYADNVAAGKETLVVIPTWDDIALFNEDARAALKARGLIHGPEIEITGSGSLSWTEIEKTHWQDYQPGHVLNFHKRVAQIAPGESLAVKEVLPNGALCEKQNGTTITITKKQRHAFDVAESQPLAVAAGDELLFRANCPEIGISNGERRKVKAVDDTGTITFQNGAVLPQGFTQVCHGHAVTSHKSQGASVDESMLVVGPHSLGAANLRQFYVSNTRFKHDHQLYVHNLKGLLGKIMNREERMLAREFVAGMGKELKSLLSEDVEKLEPTQAKERKQRLDKLLQKVERHEKAATGTLRRSFRDRLGIKTWPQALQKRWREWRQGRRRAKQATRARRAQAYAMIRRTRRGLFIWKFVRHGNHRRLNQQHNDRRATRIR